MANNDNPQALRFLESMKKHGEQEAGEKFSAKYPLGQSADASTEFEWAKNLCAFLNESYDDETVKAIRMDCACEPEYGKAEIRALYENEKDPAAFVERVNGLDLGFSLEYDGASYYLLYPQCYCPCVNHTKERLPGAWCYCTLGYSKRMFEYIFDQEVRVDLINSVKQGDADCRIRITAVREGFADPAP